MSTKLYYHGTDGVDVFVDAETNTVYHPSDRLLDVPDERVEWILSHDGWERPDRSDVQDVGEGSVDDTVRVMPSEPVQDDDSEAEVEATDVTDEDEGFDAESFIDDHAQSVASRIRQGTVDEHLDAVEAAERGREGVPREATVLKAIEARRTDLDTDDEE